MITDSRPMFRYVAPAGFPMRVRQVWNALRYGAVAGHELATLAEIGAGLGVRHLMGVSSARAGLCLALRALQRRRPERDTVAIPAYTCFSVAAAVVRAGFKVLPIEVDQQTLDFDFDDLQRRVGSRVLAVVTSNLFGIPNDVPRAAGVAHAQSAFLIDDAAQGLGAARNGKAAGTQGDIGLFSLGRGKALAAAGGGLIATDDEELARDLDRAVSVLQQCSSVQGSRLAVEAWGFAVFQRPALYWIPNSLPFLKLGVTEFDPGFALRRLPPLSLGLLHELWPGLEGTNEQRRRVARSIIARLADHDRFRAYAAPPEAKASAVRLALLAQSEELRDRAVGKLTAAGIGASAFYPSAVCDIPGIKPHLAAGHCPAARDVARRLLTLPTHAFVGPDLIERIAEILNAS